MEKLVQIWSTPIRIFHSLLLISVVTAFLSEDFEELHEIVGYTIFILVVLRLIYGFISNNKYERLSHFFYSPKEMVEFAKSVLSLNEKRYLGHNPLAGVVMFTILITLIASAITGAFGFAMKEEEGFLSAFIEVNFKLGELLLNIHELLSDLLIVLVVFHLIGVAVSTILTGENYIRAIFKDGMKKDTK